MLREALEETGLTLSRWQYRGIVTFVSDEWGTEYMHLFTADEFHGQLKDCDEGELAWIKKAELLRLTMWEGDRIFLRLLDSGEPFFSLKLCYQGEKLVGAAFIVAFPGSRTFQEVSPFQNGIPAKLVLDGEHPFLETALPLQIVLLLFLFSVLLLIVREKIHLTKCLFFLVGSLDLPCLRIRYHVHSGNVHSPDKQKRVNFLFEDTKCRVNDHLRGRCREWQLTVSVCMLGMFPAVTIEGHFPFVKPPLRIVFVFVASVFFDQAFTVKTDIQLYFCCSDSFTQQFKAKVIRHFADNDLSLFVFIWSVEHLSGTKALALRSVLFDIVYRDRFVAPGVIDQKLRIYTEKLIEQILAVPHDLVVLFTLVGLLNENLNRRFRHGHHCHVTHCEHAVLFSFRAIPGPTLQKSVKGL